MGAFLGVKDFFFSFFFFLIPGFGGIQKGAALWTELFFSLLHLSMRLHLKRRFYDVYEVGWPFFRFIPFHCLHMVKSEHMAFWIGRLCLVSLRCPCIAEVEHMALWVGWFILFIFKCLRITKGKYMAFWVGWVYFLLLDTFALPKASTWHSWLARSFPGGFLFSSMPSYCERRAYGVLVFCYSVLLRGKGHPRAALLITSA